MDKINVYFSDVFGVLPKDLEEYGAFNISVRTDLPLFIDPFLLFHSEKEEYQALHDNLIQYLKFLRKKSEGHLLNPGVLDAWYRFSEVKQTWLGFCSNGNRGSGLGEKFGHALHENLPLIFNDLGNEPITEGSHFEKFCLIQERVGKDTISDFTTNLIKEYLLEYTQKFTLKYISPEMHHKISVPKARFNYKTEMWQTLWFTLPKYKDDFVLLSPIDLLTKDDTWINKDDLARDYDQIPPAIPNAQLRVQINNYFALVLPDNPKKDDRKQAIKKVIRKFPEFIDYYIKYKEDSGEEAASISKTKVSESKSLYVESFSKLIQLLHNETNFYKLQGDSADEAYKRILYLKEVIENNDGYHIFYHKGLSIQKESDLQIMYKLTWFDTAHDVNREVNNGRGPVDFKISQGAKDKVLVEFKLAKNTGLSRNLQKQVEIYQKANTTKRSFKVIIYFSESELMRVNKILVDLNLEKSEDIILIDARRDNKPSASTA